MMRQPICLHSLYPIDETLDLNDEDYELLDELLDLEDAVIPDHEPPGSQQGFVPLGCIPIWCSQQKNVKLRHISEQLIARARADFVLPNERRSIIPEQNQPH